MREAAFWIVPFIVYFIAADLMPHVAVWRLKRGVITGVTGPEPDPNGGLEFALTFDDGPDPVFTPAILDILESYSCECTFFVLGKKCRRYPEILKRILAEGHEVGIHGWNHCHPWLQPPSPLGVGVQETLREIQRISSFLPDQILFRPPWGFWTLWNYLASRKWLRVLWSVPGRDWVKGMTPAMVAENVTRKVRPGSIILLHDGGRYSGVTVKALPAILKELMGKGYRPVTVSELVSGMCLNPNVSPRRGQRDPHPANHLSTTIRGRGEHERAI